MHFQAGVTKLFISFILVVLYSFYATPAPFLSSQCSVGLYCEKISLLKVSFLLNYELKYHPNILCNAGKLNARVN